MLRSDEQASFFTLLRNGSFLRFFLAQGFSSLGDWVGVIAIAIYAQQLGGSGGVGIVMAARVLPGFFVGPLAGVIADRWDRKKTMVVADLTRAVVVLSLPFFPNLIYFLFASAVLESLTLIWGPAKDAALPNFVASSELTHANSLSLLAIYGPWPLASIVYTLLSLLGGFLGAHVAVLSGLHGSPQALALWMDSLTFCFSAFMISTLTIPPSRRVVAKLDLGEVKRDLVEGLTFIRDHRQVRPWLLGIAGTFTAAGGVFSLGVGFARDVLNASPDRGFAFIIGCFGTGMIVGLLAAGVLAKKVREDVLFSSCILLLGFGLLALASVGSLNAAVPIATALGFFAGAGYSTGYSLIQHTTADDLRGRTFSAAYTIIRIGTLIGLSLFPSVAAIIGDHRIGEYPMPGSRLTLWLAGLVVFGGGLLSMRAIRAGRVTLAESKHEVPGCFIVFEGGEAAGKSTQMDALVRWLEGKGERVVTTREPGGTEIGERIRQLLLDPEVSSMNGRTEALLYAADRAQHVAEVVQPALESGALVVSDRFVDSSLAYQGLARGLGLEQIYEISKWATGGLMPDLVLFLDVDRVTAFERLGRDRDRMEQEDREFHDRVTAAFGELARRFPQRFVVIDAKKPQAQVHREVVTAVERRVLSARERPRSAGDLPPPTAPVNRR